MGRTYHRKTDRASKYSKETLKKAIEEINKGIITQYKASQKYHIPQMTLSYHRRGIRGQKSLTMGRSTAIPIEDEEKLAKCLTDMEKWGWGLSRVEVIRIVGEYVARKNIKTPFKNGIPGEEWFLNFCKRHKLSIKKPQAVELARRKIIDPFIINDYFKILNTQLEQLNLRYTPEQIWNLDETNFCTDPSKTKIVGKKGACSSRTTSGSGRENITVLMACSASGDKAPPLIVYKGKNVWDEWVAPQNEAYPGISYAATSKGWMEADTFLRYFETTFLPAVGNSRPILLIYDGHTSHVDERLIRTARENEITLLKLPPHSSHLLQPLDLCVFKPLKTKWDSALVEWQRHNEGRKIPKKKFSSLVSRLWRELNPEIICNGFKKGGIHPFNPDVVKAEQYDPRAYKRWQDYNKTINEQGGNEINLHNVEDEQNNSTNSEVEAGPSNQGLEANSSYQEEREASQNCPKKSCSFEELLLETVKQHKPLGETKVTKRRIATGAEVITSEEVYNRIREIKKNTQVPKKLLKETKSTKKNRQKDESEDEDSETDEEVNDDHLSAEIESVKVDDWVLVAFATKKNLVHYVGKVVSLNEKDDEIEVNFLRKVRSLDPILSSTFSWATPEDISIVSTKDIIMILPQPVSSGKRGLLRFTFSFANYNMQ